MTEVDGREVRTTPDGPDGPGAPGVLPSVDPARFVHGVVKAERGHWWRSSVGGGAKRPLWARAPDCSKPGATWNVTQQAVFEREHGSAAALAAAARWGTRPFWMGARG